MSPSPPFLPPPLSRPPPKRPPAAGTPLSRDRSRELPTAAPPKVPPQSPPPAPLEPGTNGVALQKAHRCQTPASLLNESKVRFDTESLWHISSITFECNKIHLEFTWCPNPKDAFKHVHAHTHTCIHTGAGIPEACWCDTSHQGV